VTERIQQSLARREFFK